MNPHAGKIGGKTAEKTGAQIVVKTAARTAGKIVGKIVVRTAGRIGAKTASTIAAARATPTMIDRTTKVAPGTDSVATSKIAKT